MKPRPTWLTVAIAFLAGLVIASASSASATSAEPRIIGSNGYLFGWEIKDEDGEEICTDPYVWKSIKEIECD